MCIRVDAFIQGKLCLDQNLFKVLHQHFFSCFTCCITLFFNPHFFAGTCISVLYGTSLSQFHIFIICIIQKSISKIRNTLYSCYVPVFILPSFVVLFVSALYHSSVFLCMRTEIHVGVDECYTAVLFSSFCILLYQLSCMIITVFILLDSSMLYTVIGVLYPQFSLFRKSVICTFRPQSSVCCCFLQKSTSELMNAIQLGIGQSVGGLSSKPERDLLMQDFAVIESVFYPA